MRRVFTALATLSTLAVVLESEQPPVGNAHPAHGQTMPAEALAKRLIFQVHQHARSVIDAELNRLARRVPGLPRADLDLIEATLDELADSLMLARLRAAPQHSAPKLIRLFGIEADSTEPGTALPAFGSERMPPSSEPISPFKEPAS